MAAATAIGTPSGGVPRRPPVSQSRVRHLIHSHNSLFWYHDVRSQSRNLRSQNRAAPPPPPSVVRRCLTNGLIPQWRGLHPPPRQWRRAALHPGRARPSASALAPRGTLSPNARCRPPRLPGPFPATTICSRSCFVGLPDLSPSLSLPSAAFEHNDGRLDDKGIINPPFPFLPSPPVDSCPPLVGTLIPSSPLIKPS